LQRAVDAGNGRAEQLCDLARLPPQHVSQDQHRALLRCEVLQCGNERKSNRFAQLSGFRRVPVNRHHVRVGDRFDPRRFLEALTQR
jgi:hypothetical protein